MKITYVYSRTKEVVYAGVKVRIKRYHDWIAADEDGTVYSYRNKPVIYEPMNQWHDKAEPSYIGDAELQDTDWRETLEYVGEGGEEEDQF